MNLEQQIMLLCGQLKIFRIQAERKQAIRIESLKRAEHLAEEVKEKIVELLVRG